MLEIRCNTRWMGKNAVGLTTHNRIKTIQKLSTESVVCQKQQAFIKSLLDLINSMQYLACSYDITIAAVEGRMALDGTVEVYDQRSKEITSDTIKQIKSRLLDFNEQWMSSTLVIRANQALTVTKVYAYGQG